MGSAVHGIALARVAALAGVLLAASPSPARVEAVCGYTLAQAYSGALRYLRVDKGYEVYEKDAEAAYLLFCYVAPGSPPRPTDGSIELVRARDKVKLLVRLPAVAEYHEQLLRDELVRKLQSDYGQPPPSGPKKDRTKAVPGADKK
jgi:hypothetical protein